MRDPRAAAPNTKASRTGGRRGTCEDGKPRHFKESGLLDVGLSHSNIAATGMHFAIHAKAAMPTTSLHARLKAVIRLIVGFRVDDLRIGKIICWAGWLIIRTPGVKRRLVCKWLKETACLLPSQRGGRWSHLLSASELLSMFLCLHVFTLNL